MPSHISRDDLHHQITNGQGPVLVEALGAAYYADAHLPGATNIPPGQVDALAAVLLPNRRQPIVVYGTATSASAAAVAKRLEELGYTTVALYRGGKEDWAEHGLPLERVNTRQPVARTARDASSITGRYKPRGVRFGSSSVDEQEKP